MLRYLSDVVEVLTSVSVCIPCTAKEMSSWSWSIFNIRLPLNNYHYILVSCFSKFVQSRRNIPRRQLHISLKAIQKCCVAQLSSCCVGNVEKIHDDDDDAAAVEILRLRQFSMV